MELSTSQLKNAHHLFSSSSCPSICPTIVPKPTQIRLLSQSNRSLRLGKNGCAKGDNPVAEVEAEMMKSEEEWWTDGKEGKCKGRRGIVELMECLEKEAIMGEDEGKEASDYNRRAQIFDKSSRVFQALKEQTKHS